MNAENEIYDVVIVGAGPIGLACGIEARRRGLSHLIMEKGCLVNSIFHYPVNMTFFSTSERLEIGEVPFISHGNKPTRREALEYYRRTAAAWKLNINLYERVLDVNGAAGDFGIESEKGSYRARTVIISTGYYDNPNRMNIPGETLPKVKHYYKEPHPCAFRKVAVIGGANSAADVALETFRSGAEVTMIVREPELSDRIKYWVRPDIDNRIKEGSIRVYFNSEVLEIRENEIVVQTPEAQLTLKNDFVFAMTGYHPDFDFLQRIHLRLKDDRNRTPDFSPETFETNHRGIFLAGVVCAGMETSRLLIENSRVHAVKIFDHLQKQIGVR